MKVALALAAILAVLVTVNSAVFSSSRSGLELGFTTSGDVLLFSEQVNRTAEANTVQIQDVVYNGDNTTIITRILATELQSDRASIWITSGGLAQSHVTAKIHSYRGQGYNYLVQVWGH